MRDLRSDAICPSKFFAAYRCRTTPAKQAWSKKYIRGKQVEDRISIVSYLLLSLSASLLTFCSFSLLCSKTKTTHHKTKGYTSNDQHASPFFSLFSPRTSVWPSRKLLQGKPSLFPFSFSCLTHKSRVSSSANTNHREQFLKFRRLYPAIRTSFTLWSWRKLSWTWLKPKERPDWPWSIQNRLSPRSQKVVVTTRKKVRLPAKFLPSHLGLLVCLRKRSQRSSKTGFDPWTCTTYSTLRATTPFTNTRSPSKMVPYRSGRSEDPIGIMTTTRLFNQKFFSITWPS